jgi:tricorn protease
MKTSLLTLLLAAFLCTSGRAQQLHFADHPALTPDGQTLVFAYNGDLWTVPADGGAANRITALDGAESHPRVSPDGKWLAFTSGQYGNADVYVTPLTGGPIKQLTYHQATDQVANWSWDSETVYFTSNRYNRITTFTVPTSGGTPQRLMSHYFNITHNVVPLPGSATFLFNETWESNNFTHRKGYKGPYNPDVKRYNPKTNTVTQLTKWEGKDMWPMADRRGNTFFVSDRDNGEYNLYSLGKDGKTKRLTKHTTSVFNPSLSADGSKIAYVRDYQLEVYDVASGRSKAVAVTLNSFVGLDKTADFKTDGNISYFDVARDGKKLATVSRGELFVSDMEGKFVRQIMTGNEMAEGRQNARLHSNL